MTEPQISRGTVALARGIAAAGLTRQEAGAKADWHYVHLGKVLKGKPPGAVAQTKALVFVRDKNLWDQPASEEDVAEWREHIATIDARSRQRKPS